MTSPEQSEAVGELHAEVAVDNYVPITLVRHAIVHTMVRKGGKGHIEARDAELPVTELAQRLVDTLHSEYRRRHAKSHGKFNGNEETAPSQKHAQAYLLGGTGNFYDFSVRMANLLCDKAEGRAATGGHIFIAHLEGDGRELLLISIVTDEQAIALNKKKDLAAAEHLNLKGFRFAGRIDVTAWREKTERYVSFLKGTKDVSDYFKAFLGCDTAIPNLADTQHLTKVVREFAYTTEVDGKPLNEKERDEFLWKVDARCRKMAEESAPLDIGAFANEMWPDDPKALVSAIVETEHPVSDGFVPNKRGLQGLVNFRGKTKHWELKFNRHALTERDVDYCDEDRTIILRNIPADLIARLRQEEGNRTEGE